MKPVSIIMYSNAFSKWDVMAFGSTTIHPDSPIVERQGVVVKSGPTINGWKYTVIPFDKSKWKVVNWVKIIRIKVLAYFKIITP